MLKIKLDYVDELITTSRELCVVTYLQALVRQNEYDGLPVDTFDSVHEYAHSYLYDLQEELVLKIKELIEKDDFAVPTK